MSIQIPWIAADAPPASLPPASQSLQQPNGLLAGGGSLSPDWLLHAYAHGIFPWFQDDQPILWWSPDPRTVLRPDKFHKSRSLLKTIRRGIFTVSADTAFDEVMDACAGPRRSGSGTWITDSMTQAYTEAHRLGFAHSIEAWHDGKLAGGVYGISIGAVFFGESMFSRVSNASKVTLAAATDFFAQSGIELLDCQMPSPHLTSLGAESIPRGHFLNELARLCPLERPRGPWTQAFENALQKRD